MPKYNPGDVVLASFPFEETSDTKPRPVVIVEVFHDSSFSCMITGTDWSGRKKGIEVKKDSEEAKQMGLEKDSFINAERTEIISNSMIFFKIGVCPCLEDLEKLIG